MSKSKVVSKKKIEYINNQFKKWYDLAGYKTPYEDYLKLDTDMRKPIFMKFIKECTKSPDSVVSAIELSIDSEQLWNDLVYFSVWKSFKYLNTRSRRPVIPKALRNEIVLIKPYNIDNFVDRVANIHGFTNEIFKYDFRRNNYEQKEHKELYIMQILCLLLHVKFEYGTTQIGRILKRYDADGVLIDRRHSTIYVHLNAAIHHLSDEFFADSYFGKIYLKTLRNL